MSSTAARMQLERSSVSESITTVVMTDPNQSEIATMAYRLWQESGCPVGSDQDDWFRAEAMLKCDLVNESENLSRHPSSPNLDTHMDFEMTVECTGLGHWEVWEREWGGARWVWDVGYPRR